jgi:ABC-type nitrate/sulfonate/bicarbonate transport system permease component
LRESVFLADTVYCDEASARPIRGGGKRKAPARARASLEITYTLREFSDIVHELRVHIGRGRQSGAVLHEDHGASSRTLAPVIVLVAALAGSARRSSRLAFRNSSSPALADCAPDDRSSRASSPAHAWRTYWVTMAGFGIAIVVGVLLGFLIGSSRPGLCGCLSADDGLQRLAQGGLRADPGRWFGIGAGPAILTAFLISFFPIMVNIATGLATLEPELEDVLRVLGAKRWDVLIKVGLPRSMPTSTGP